MNNWRQDTATEAQKRRLKEEGIKFSSSITKGEASDLIGNTIEPDDYEVAILKFFKITSISKMTQTEAKRKIESIFDNAENKKRWENRPVDKNQKEIYKFFGFTTPSNLSYKDAEVFISELFDDEEKINAWDTHENEREYRDSWLEDNYEGFNRYRDLYECKKINKKLFYQIIDSLESSGMTLEQIEQNEYRFFKRAFEINPELRNAFANRSTSSKVRSRQTHDSQVYSNQDKSDKGGCGIIIIFVFIIFLLLVIL